MNSLTRWNPIQEMMTLTNQFDRLFENTFTVSRAPLSGRQQRIWTMPLDVRETDDAYIVQASVPGFDPQQIDVTLDRNVLTIKALLDEEELEEDEIYHLRERRFGQFSRSISLPSDVVAEEIEASVELGVLTVYVPKHESSKPKHIPVQGSTHGAKQLVGNSQDVIEGETG